MSCILKPDAPMSRGISGWLGFRVGSFLRLVLTFRDSLWLQQVLAYVAPSHLGRAIGHYAIGDKHTCVRITELFT